MDVRREWVAALIVADSSPLIAIVKDEADAEAFRTIFARSRRIVIAAPTKLEVMMVAGGRLGAKGVVATQSLLDSIEAEIVPLDESHVDLAVQAFMQYGKGRGHPAQLNFGDCMAYALAKSLEAPLLYKGGDFALTDVRSAMDGA
jgi:ribonuclease VapC